MIIQFPGSHFMAAIFLQKGVYMSYQLSNFKDVDNTVMPIINQYYAYLEQNDIYNANRILQENASLLKPYSMDANTINKMERAISELGDIAFSTQQIIISQSEPDNIQVGVGSEWYQPY